MNCYRVVSMNKAGAIETKDFPSGEALAGEFEQIGIEEDSYTMKLHGEPVFRGLIGPLSEARGVIRYETPEAFVSITEEWSKSIRDLIRDN